MTKAKVIPSQLFIFIVLPSHKLLVELLPTSRHLTTMQAEDKEVFTVKKSKCEGKTSEQNCPKLLSKL